MIKKRKIMIIIHIFIIASYLLSSVFLFSSFKMLKYNEMSKFSKDLTEYPLLPYSDKNISSDEYIKNFNSYFTAFPAIIALYNKDCEMVLKSGSYISFVDENYENKIIFIDEYLTEEIKKQIVDSNQKKANNYGFDVNEFKYTEIDNKLIPVSIVMTNFNSPFNKIEIKFTDYNGYKTINKMVYIDLIDIDKNAYEHKIYNELNQKILINKNEIETLFKKGSGGGYYGGEETLQTGYVPLADGEYVYCISTLMHPNIETLRSSNFKSYLVNLTFLFLIFYFIVVITLCKILKKAKKLDEAKIAFTSAAAHELKTPLAIIENQCECIMENIAPEKNSEYVKSIYNESLRMNKLVATLLQYNRLASTESIAKERCDLIDIINNEIEKYTPLMEAKNIKLKKHINCTSAKMKCNKDLISLVVDNYISNAIKHTENGNAVDIKLYNESNSYKVTVFNEGKGIKNEYKDKLWDIFYKDDESRNRDDNSTGMGLAICKQILELHNYKYGFVNRHNGVEFYFTT